jgi:hypothetical protein
MSRILLDQNVPRGLRQHLRGHDVETAAHRSWGTLANGELIAAAEAAGFQFLITADQNLRYQQNIAGRVIAIVVSRNQPLEYDPSQRAPYPRSRGAAPTGPFPLDRYYRREVGDLD